MKSISIKVSVAAHQPKPTSATRWRLAFIHRFLDSRPAPSRTWHFELGVRMTMEVLLLILCALPVVTSWRAFVAQVIIGAVRFAEAWIGHEGRNIQIRLKEQGIVTSNEFLPREKRVALQRLADCDRWGYWAWPVVVPLVQAAEAQAFGIAVVLTVAATLCRRWLDRGLLPAWRRSRLEWRKRDV